jgi:capsule polysaccharide export protein KpsE/RkpR
MKQKISNSELGVVYHPELPVVDPTQDTREDAVIGRLRLLWEHRSFLARVTVIGVVLSVIIALLVPKRFESTTRLMPPDSQSSGALAMAAALSGRAGGLGALAGDMLGLKTSGALFIGILTSRTVQDDLVKKFDLRKIYGSATLESTRKRLAQNTAISEDHKSGIITITTSDTDPNRAAAMGEEYVAELNTVVNQLSTSSARRERIFLEERLGQVKLELERAEKDFGDFASKNTAVDIKEQAKAMVGAAAMLQGELIATQSQLEGLKKIYTENNVRVRSLRARADELQSQLNKMGGKDESSTAVAAEGDADSKTDSLYPSIRKLPMLGVAYADLYRQTKVQETVFEVLTQQYELAKVSEAKETPDVKVLDPSNVPERRAAPSRSLIVVVGMLFSFMLAVLWIVARARWEEFDEHRPAKIFIREVVSGIRSSATGNPNGSLHPRSAIKTIRARLHRNPTDLEP